jgi:hypothetical protein
MDAHNAQRQGKKGLGKSDKLKIAGMGDAHRFVGCMCVRRGRGVPQGARRAV